MPHSLFPSSNVHSTTFNPIALALHPTQPFKRGVLRRIGQGNLCIRITPQRLRCNQSPAFYLLGVTVPYINFQTTDPDPEHTTGGFTQCHCFPALCREVIQRSPNFNAFLITPILCNWTSGLVSFFEANRVLDLPGILESPNAHLQQKYRPFHRGQDKIPVLYRRTPHQPLSIHK